MPLDLFPKKMWFVVFVLLIRREMKLKKLDNFITHQIIFEKKF